MEYHEEMRPKVVIIETTEPNPPQRAMPPEPEGGSGYRAAVRYIAWYLKCNRIAAENERIRRAWPYARDVEHSPEDISIAGMLLKIACTGETVLVDHAGRWRRGWGAALPTPVEEGMQAIVMSPPYSVGSQVLR